jgi:hypothetical protein
MCEAFPEATHFLPRYYARKQAKQAAEAQKKSEAGAGGAAAVGGKARSVFDDEHGDYIIRYPAPIYASLPLCD